MDGVQFAAVDHIGHISAHLPEIAGYAGDSTANEFIDGLVIVGNQSYGLSEIVSLGHGFS